MPNSARRLRALLAFADITDSLPIAQLRWAAAIGAAEQLLDGHRVPRVRRVRGLRQRPANRGTHEPAMAARRRHTCCYPSSGVQLRIAVGRWWPGGMSYVTGDGVRSWSKA